MENICASVCRLDKGRLCGLFHFIEYQNKDRWMVMTTLGLQSGVLHFYN